MFIKKYFTEMDENMKIIEFKNLLTEKKLLVDYKCDDVDILGVSYDSREIKENFLFYCKGKTFKEDYLIKAKENGAVCYISEKEYDVNMNCIIVSDIRKAMAYVSAHFYEYAFKDLEIIGITGTKGKTTVTYFLKSILDEHVHKKSAVISTVEVYTGSRCEEAHLTTPEAPFLHKLFKETKDNNFKTLTMEVTSQAYKTDRVLGVEFSHGMFLNISEDHISEAEHRDFKDYLSCKLELIKNSKDMIINKNSDCFDVIKSTCENYKKPYITYGDDDSCDYKYYNITKTISGFKFNVKSKNFNEVFEINMAGRFNVENATAAIAMASEIGIDLKNIKTGILTTNVIGRMNVFDKDGYTVIVDFAHNELSYTKLYESIKLDYPNRNIISLGGSVGGKALNRRKSFGKIVGAGSNHIVLTMDNPEYESVNDICLEMARYIPDTCTYEIIEDRKTAIEKVLENAKKGDVIVLLSKSEEEYQKIKDTFVYYESDLKIAKRLLSV